MLKRFSVLYFFLYSIIVISDIYSIFSINSGEDNQGFNNFYSPDIITIAESLIIHFFFLFSFFGTIYLFDLVHKKSQLIENRNVERIDISKNVILKIVLILIILTAFFRIKTVFSIGFLNYIYQVRSGDSTIGGIMYIVLLSLPILLLYKMPNIFRYLLVILMIVLNLLSGFRLILIWSFLILLFYKWSESELRFNKKKLFGLIIVAISFVSFGVIREIYQFEDNTSSFANFISKAVLSTNRSSPVTYLSYIIKNNLSFEFSGLFKIIYSPLLAFIDFIIDIGYIPQDSFEIKVFSEKLFRPFLIFRGTGAYDATGFSLHFIPFFYSFGGIFIIPFIGFFFGLFFYYSINLMKSHFFFTKVNGVLLIVFLFSCLESFSVAWGLFLYSYVIFFILKVIKQLFGNLINQSNFK